MRFNLKQSALAIALAATCFLGLRFYYLQVERTKQARDESRLSQLEFGLVNYEFIHGESPPMENSNVSWRVELLPFIGTAEAGSLFEQYDPDSEWNGEHNRQLAAAESVLSYYQSEFGARYRKVADIIAIDESDVHIARKRGWLIKKVNLKSRHIWIAMHAKSEQHWMNPDDYSYARSLLRDHKIK